MSLLPVVPAALIGVCVAVLPLALRAQATDPSAWSRCCQTQPWGTPKRGGPLGHMRGHGMMGGSMARHRQAMMGTVPAPYTNLRNPLPVAAKTIERGGEVYSAHCASCHGASGRGDGPAATGLVPPPANLAWLSRMPMHRWDAIMFWTIAEGGAQFDTAMPAFKSKLAVQDIWAVTAYIQAHLPAPETGTSP